MNGLEYFDGVNKEKVLRERNSKYQLIGILLICCCFLPFFIYAIIVEFGSSRTNYSSLFFGSTILFLGMIAAGIIVIIIGNGKKTQTRIYLTDSSYDELIKGLLNKKASNPKEYLGLDDTEVLEINPIEFEGYKYTNSSRLKIGQDGFIRSDLYERATIFFTRNEVHMYKATVNSITGRLTETTQVLFYNDVVSVSTETESAKYDQTVTENLSFVLTSKGGNEFKVSINGSDNTQRSINAMRALIKEKKSIG